MERLGLRATLVVIGCMLSVRGATLINNLGIGTQKRIMGSPDPDAKLESVEGAQEGETMAASLPNELGIGIRLFWARNGNWLTNVLWFILAVAAIAAIIIYCWDKKPRRTVDEHLKI